jgi:SAM-dependent methyltransferase
MHKKEANLSTEFYSKLLDKQPILNVPGMTEFSLSENSILGLMPIKGIETLLENRINVASKTDNKVKAELYLVTMIKKFFASQFKKPRGLFGNFYSKLMEKGNSRNYVVLINELNIQPNDKILEIGYGPGIGIRLILEKCNSCLIHGIDFSKLMYRKASELNRKSIHDKKVELFLADFLSVSFESNYYDKIFCLNVIYFWDNLLVPFQTIKSVLNSDGIFCFYMAHKDYLIKKTFPDSIFNKYSIEEVVSALYEAGFTNVEYKFDKGYYVEAQK